MHMNLTNVIFGGSVTGVSDRSGAYDGSVQAWLPIKDIVQGVVAVSYTHLDVYKRQIISSTPRFMM